MTIDTKPQRTVLYNDTFEYQPHYSMSGNLTKCHLLVWKEFPEASNTLVMATELHGNSGKSITNSSEALATEVVKKFNLVPEDTRFIEHYSDKISYGYHGIPNMNPDHYSLVEYTWKLEIPGAMYQGTQFYQRQWLASQPQWTPVAYEQVLRLLDRPILSAIPFAELLEMPETDYEFIAILENSEDQQAPWKYVALPLESPNPVIWSELSQATPSVLKYQQVQFVYGIARQVKRNIVDACMTLGMTNVRFYAVSREFEKSL